MLVTRPDPQRFEGAALRLAREYRALSQQQLAELVGCHPDHVRRLEKGHRRVPDDLLLEALSEVLGFPVVFFLQPAPVGPDARALHYRKRAAATLRKQNSAVARGALLVAIQDLLEEHLDLPGPNFPPCEVVDGSDVEAAAEHCRNTWGVPLDAPIASVVRLLESAGALVGLFADETMKVSGFSWIRGRPLVMSSVDQPPSMARLTLAHECGHLVMHRGKHDADHRQREKEAHRFAGALLVPRAAFWREFPRPSINFDWSALVEFKEHWGLGIQASLMRAKDLEIITAAELRRGFMAISRYGWRRSEPGEVFDPEVPHLLPDALRLVEEELGVNVRRLSERRGLPLDGVVELAGIERPDPEPTPPPNVLPLRARRTGG